MTSCKTEAGEDKDQYVLNVTCDQHDPVKRKDKDGKLWESWMTRDIVIIFSKREINRT